MEWIQEHWAQLGVIVLAAHTLLKAIADAIDTNTEEENTFEKIVGTIGKVIAYIFGKRSV